MTNFDLAFSTLIGNEGGYSNNSSDPGGETMWGITKAVALANGYTGDMVKLPQDTAKIIAKKVYWDPYYCDNLPYDIAFQLFDTAYNGGYAVKWLQQSVGTVADGHIGPETLTAANNANIWEVVAKFNAYRLQYYTSLPTWNSFGKGWTNRISNNILRVH